MKKLYLNLENQTITNLDTFETCQYDNFYETIMDKNEATKIYIYDLAYYWRYITRQFLDNGMSCIQFTGGNETLPRNSFTVTSSFRETSVVKIKAKGSQIKDHNTTILDARGLLGAATIEEIKNSTEIDDENESIAYFLNYMIEEGHTRGTLSANAFKSLLELMYPKSNSPLLSFQNDFKLTKEMDAFCRRGYHGGFCWIKPECRNIYLQTEGLTYDVNSLFPSVMEKEWLPFGTPTSFEGEYIKDKRMPLYFQEVMIFNLELKDKGIPCIKQETTDSLYFEANTLYPFVSLVLNHVDMELLKDNYNFDEIHYVGGYKFAAKKKMFNSFIKHWKEEKIAARESGDKLREKIAKLMLNSCYGKFGTKIDRVPVNIKVLESGVIAKLPVLESTNEGTQYYVPLASYISSYGKKQLIDAIKANYDRIVYVDTDSIHLVGTEAANGIVEHNSEFGAWKLERTWKEGKFVSLKKYAELDENGWTVKCAGLPVDIIEEVEKDIELFQLGQEFEYTDTIINMLGEKENVLRSFTLEENSLERI